MVNIIKQEIEMEIALKNKIEFICSFCNTTPIIHNGSIRTIEHTNISLIKMKNLRHIYLRMNYLRENSY